MTLNAALRKAEIEGATHVYRLRYPGIHRGIHTTFDTLDHTMIDWQVSQFKGGTLGVLNAND